MNNEEKILLMLEGLVADVKDLKTDVAGLKTDVAGLKTDVAGLKNDVQVLKQDVQVLKQDVQVLKQEMKEVKQDLRDVKDRLIIIENDHGQDIKALYDRYSLTHDICKEIREEIGKMSARMARQDDHITLLQAK